MDKYSEFKKQISSYMVNFYYKIIRKPMLEFKRNILSQVRKRQQMEEIIKKVDDEIAAAKLRYESEFSCSYTPNSTNNDAMHKNVQKLEKKVNHLAKSVHDLFVQLDNAKSEKNNHVSGAK